MSSSWLVTSCSWPVSSAHLKHLRQSPEPSILLQMKCWQNRCSLKIQKQKNPTTLAHPWAPLVPVSNAIFHFACMAALIKTASQFWCCAAQLSGMEWHVSLTLNRLSWLGFHELFRGHMHTPMYSYIYSTLHAPPPTQKKIMVHFWDFAPGENGKNKHNKRDVNGLSELPVFLPIFTTVHSTITSSTDPGRDRRQSETVWRTWLCNVWFTFRDGYFLRQNWRYAMCYPAEIIMKNHCFSPHDRWDVHVWIFFRYFHTSIFGATVWCMSSLKGVSRVWQPEPSGVREGPRGLFWNMAAFDSNAILVGW